MPPPARERASREVVEEGADKKRTMKRRPTRKASKVDEVGSMGGGEPNNLLE